VGAPLGRLGRYARVLPRSTVTVLGMITAALALAALAAQQPPDRGTPTLTAARPQAAAPSVAALRALRDGARIDVNRASAADLELLPGVGPTLARRIVDHRNAHGAFGAAGDLLQVRGIGARTLERLTPLLAFSPPAPAQPAQPSIIQTTPAVTAK
jgi:competence ComEA-like helix-hairpin-helix protein